MWLLLLPQGATSPGWDAVRNLVAANIANWQAQEAAARRWKQPSKPPTWEDVILLVRVAPSTLHTPHRIPVRWIALVMLTFVHTFGSYRFPDAAAAWGQVVGRLLSNKRIRTGLLVSLPVVLNGQLLAAASQPFSTATQPKYT